jgi:hypothetical protein
MVKPVEPIALQDFLRSVQASSATQRAELAGR